ncbi:TfoX/Sxy family DNA transformation protein [Rhodoferax antarcticus]|nr:TfoX/Sxy family DNA transformation protein [Rhodoferax antarcticus]
MNLTFDVFNLILIAYSFEGALTDKHWNELGEKRKQQLKAQVD